MMSADILYVAPTVYLFIYFIYNQIVQNKKYVVIDSAVKFIFRKTDLQCVSKRDQT